MIHAMILSLSLIGGKPCPPQAPPVNMRFSTTICICMDGGAPCVCKRGECHCADCPTRVEPAHKNKMPKIVQRIVGYRYERVCHGGYCQSMRVPIYVTETVYE